MVCTLIDRRNDVKMFKTQEEPRTAGELFHCKLNRISHYLSSRDFKRDVTRPGRGGGALPYKRLMVMCRWMGSQFHDWTDYNGVAFSKELLEWDRTFSDFCEK